MTCCSRLALLPLRLRPPTLGRRSVVSGASLSPEPPPPLLTRLASRSLLQVAERPRLMPTAEPPLELLGLFVKEDTRRSMSMLYVLRALSSSSLPDLDLYLGSARSSGKIWLDSNDRGLDLTACWTVPAPLLLRSVLEGRGIAPTVKPLGLPTVELLLELLREERVEGTSASVSGAC